MKKVTRTELRELLEERTDIRYKVAESAIEKCVILGLDPSTAPIPAVEEEVVLVATTEPKMRKTGNPYIGRVVKISKVSGFINWSYGEWVNNQREREGGFAVLEGGAVRTKEVEKFTPKERKWGVRKPRSPYVAHKGGHYLEIGVLDSLGHAYYLDGERLVDDSPVLAEIKTFMSGGGGACRQDVEKKVILRDYREASITALEVDPKGSKLKFAVVDDEREERVAA